jgi:hypothetical protein
MAALRRLAARLLADVCALVWDLVHSPREVLLVRCHHQWVGAGYIAMACAPVALGWQIDRDIVFAVLLVGGVSWTLDLVGTAAHIAWRRGRIWQDIECPCCDGPDDGGPDDDEPAGPDSPDDDHGIALEAEAWLRSLTTRHEAAR